MILERFQIKELFGRYDVDIPFENDINIFVGENGIGKTTILNCINYVLQCDSDNLYNIDFKKIIVTFGSGKILEINHEDIITDKMFDLEHRRRHYLFEDDKEIKVPSTISVIRKVYKELKKDKLNSKVDIYILITRILRQRYNIEVSRFLVENAINEIDNRKDFFDWEEIVQNEINENIIYLPTYRRIEEDFNKCMDNDIRYRNDLMKKISNMKFGMNDVELQIKSLCEELKDTTNEAFKEMTGNLLKNYVEIYAEKKKKRIKKTIDPSKLFIVFERLADRIDEDVKESIINLLIEEKNIDDLGYKYLVSIIDCLQDIYEKTKDIDECLNDFTETCNKYLEDKKFKYNPFKIECELIEESLGENIEFKNLSSGEKQIISLFSKIYLSKTTKNIILFDEPELSLSILWQERLVPDMIESNKCEFAIIITHSPFIFNNTYKFYARDIKSYITKIKNPKRGDVWD